MPPKITAADKALQRARVRGEIRKEVAGAVSTGKIQIAREKGRQRRSVEKARSVTRIQERVASESARRETVERRVQLRQQEIANRAVQRAQTQRDLAGIARSEKLKNQLIFGSTSAVSSGTSSIRSTAFLILTLFFVLIILYVLVRNSENVSGFLSGVGSFIRGLSSNAPLFQKTETQ